MIIKQRTKSDVKYIIFCTLPKNIRVYNFLLEKIFIFVNLSERTNMCVINCSQMDNTEKFLNSFQIAQYNSHLLFHYKQNLL